MSRCVLRQLQNYGRSYQASSASGVTSLTSNLRKYSRNNNDNGKSSLGQTTILVQKGVDIQELPVILRKMNKDEFATICSDQVDDTEEHSAATISESIFKTEHVIEHLNNCITAAGVLHAIHQIPENELCPEVAAHAFNRLIRNESMIVLKNLEQTSPVFEKLIVCILENGDHKMLLDFMELLKTFLDLQKTLQRFCDELLTRNSDGILNIVEVCECIDRFVDCKQQEAAEKFWTGIADNEKVIDDTNIKFIYAILPKVKISRRLIIGVLERRIFDIWWHLTPEAVSEILTSLTYCETSPFRTMQALARFLNTNIHAINENHLENILQAFTKLDFSDNQIEKGLERYVKAKILKVRTESLLAKILSYCSHFRIRNEKILNGCSEYFITKHDQIDPNLIKFIIIPYGHLSYQPQSGIQFWQALERYLRKNFSRIPPQDSIEIFLNCCYLEMYPLNFVTNVFNPNFLDLMHTSTPPEQLQKVRGDLKMFDTTLAMECPNYAGPLLPRDHSAKSIWQDGRIKRITNNISEYVEELAGGPDNITTNAIYAKLPMNSMYIIDILIHPPGMGNLWSYSTLKDRNVYVAVLIHLPDYYNSTGEFLIGPQVMRIRQFRKLGMKVVTLNYDTLSRLRMHPKQLQQYLVERVKGALPALPEK